MPEPKTLKKSESLEIRIPYPTKLAFMARCRDEGRSASEALRDFIEGHLAAGVQEPSLRRTGGKYRLILAALAAAAAATAAAPSLARVSLGAVSEPAEFHRLDANGDGVLTLDEYRR